ncbi:Catalase [Ammonifex degensii KC4]|uniref:Catalase n=1 Tax=Ammonifex degensii (strain DSM 10501 / KC4) TaxID=429009 RepID=C9R990_AMMDK|nr:manganese catalase family protein [Ammonifex degensii]ACX52869.1 Catalase [Ammonifex degensii KC4]
MFYHRKDQLLFPVSVSKPDPRFAVMLMEQLAGQNGEVAAGLQYILQGLKCKDPEIKDLLLDIGIEELNHMEMLIHSISLLTEGQVSTESPEEYALQLLGGGGAVWLNSVGAPFCGSYVDTVGDLVADLQSNIAAEFRAKAVYERLHRQATDPKIKEMLEFLISREEAHAAMFRGALEKLMQREEGVRRDFADTQYAQQYYNFSQP